LPHWQKWRARMDELGGLTFGEELAQTIAAHVAMIAAFFAVLAWYGVTPLDALKLVLRGIL
jgi:hypothetical protein